MTVGFGFLVLFCFIAAVVLTIFLCARSNGPTSIAAILAIIVGVFGSGVMLFLIIRLITAPS